MFHESPEAWFVTELPSLMANASLVVGMAYLRAFAAALVVLFLPGYSLVLAFYANQAQDSAERIALSVGLSLVTAVFAGIFLNILPMGLTAGSLLFFEVVVTLSSGAVALLRRGGKRVVRHAGKPLLGAGRQVIWLALPVAVAIIALAYTRIQMREPFTTGFTQLWALPASGYDMKVVELGIRSMEREPVVYALHLTIGTETVMQWDAIELAPGEIWRAKVGLPFGWADAGSDLKVELNRVVGESTVSYRSLEIKGIP